MNRLDQSVLGEYAQDVANDIRQTMQQHAGVFRIQASMDQGVIKIAAITERVKAIRLDIGSNFLIQQRGRFAFRPLLKATAATDTPGARATATTRWMRVGTCSTEVGPTLRHLRVHSTR